MPADNAHRAGCSRFLPAPPGIVTAVVNDRLAGSARRQCVHGAVLFVTSRRPLGIVTAVVNDRLAEQLPKTHVILSEAVGGVEESAMYKRNRKSMN